MTIESEFESFNWSQDSGDLVITIKRLPGGTLSSSLREGLVESFISGDYEFEGDEFELAWVSDSHESWLMRNALPLWNSASNEDEGEDEVDFNGLLGGSIVDLLEQILGSSE